MNEQDVQQLLSKLANEYREFDKFDSLDDELDDLAVERMIRKATGQSKRENEHFDQLRRAGLFAASILFTLATFYGGYRIGAARRHQLVVVEKPAIDDLRQDVVPEVSPIGDSVSPELQQRSPHIVLRIPTEPLRDRSPVSSTTDQASRPPLLADGAPVLTDSGLHPKRLVADVHLRFRHDGKRDVMPILLRVDGNNAVGVNRIEFDPMSDIRVEDSTLQYGSYGQGVMKISLDASHDTATEAGRHSTYTIEFATPTLIVADQIMPLVLQIASADHIGYGFIGNLRLYYDDDNVLLLNNVDVVFRSPTYAGDWIPVVTTSR